MKCVPKSFQVQVHCTWYRIQWVKWIKVDLMGRNNRDELVINLVINLPWRWRTYKKKFFNGHCPDLTPPLPRGNGQRGPFFSAVKNDILSFSKKYQTNRAGVDPLPPKTGNARLKTFFLVWMPSLMVDNHQKSSLTLVARRKKHSMPWKN